MKKLSLFLLTLIALISLFAPARAFAVSANQTESPEELMALGELTLRYSEWDGVWNDNYANYNSYGYALGNTSLNRGPGYLTGRDNWYDMHNLQYVTELVISDLSILGYTCISTSLNTYTTPDAGLHLICLRGNFEVIPVGTVENTRFHFMKYDNGAWYHKMFDTAILKYKGIPDCSQQWTDEKVVNASGKVVMSALIYDEDISFISFRVGHYGSGASCIYYNSGSHKVLCDNCSSFSHYAEHTFYQQTPTRKVCSGCGYGVTTGGSTIEPWDVENIQQ